MDDFSFPGFANDYNLPPAAANRVRAGKRPLSSMSPAIFLDSTGRARLVVGASGGSKITTATALTAVRVLMQGEAVATAVNRPRLHHQLSPNRVDYQSQLEGGIVTGLAGRGHVTRDMGGAGSVVGAIAVKGGEESSLLPAADKRVQASADYRKAGGVDGF